MIKNIILNNYEIDEINAYVETKKDSYDNKK